MGPGWEGQEYGGHFPAPSIGKRGGGGSRSASRDGGGAAAFEEPPAATTAQPSPGRGGLAGKSHGRREQPPGHPPRTAHCTQPLRQHSGDTQPPARGQRQPPARRAVTEGPRSRAGPRWGRGHRGAHLWGMSSMLTRPQTPTTKVSTSHSLTPRAMRKWPPSPHAVPHELAAVCRGDTGHGW